MLTVNCSSQPGAYKSSTPLPSLKNKYWKEAKINSFIRISPNWSFQWTWGVTMCLLISNLNGMIVNLDMFDALMKNKTIHNKNGSLIIITHPRRSSRVGTSTSMSWMREWTHNISELVWTIALYSVSTLKRSITLYFSLWQIIRLP